MRRSCLVKVVLVGALFLSLGFPDAAVGQVVSPIQTGHYSPATQNVRDMSNPIPGLFPIWYNMYAFGDTWVDRDGNKLTNLDQILPNLDVDVKLDLKTVATIPMVFWASRPIGFLGGANYLGGLSLNYAFVEGTVVTERQAIIGDSTITRVSDGSYSGLGDMFFLPLGLSWGLEKADLTLTYGFAAPTGTYETGGEDNLGLGFWTHQFQGFGYFYPVPEKSTALMVGMTFEVNSTIKDADVRPGSRFSVEYGISQYLTERLELAAQGGHNFQITDDSGEDVCQLCDPSVHDKKSTLAFYGNFWAWKERLAVSLKYGFDYGARQRFLTNYLMLNILFIPDILTGS